MKSSLLSPSLCEEIKKAFKERVSVVAILEEHNFKGEREELHELMSLFVELIGPRMTLELFFSANEALWEGFRETLTPSDWETIARESNFLSAHYLLLGESLFQRGETEAAIKILHHAVNIAAEKDFSEIAYVVSRELKDSLWARNILLKAEISASTCEDYIILGQSFINLANDENEGRRIFSCAKEKAVQNDEFISLATAIASTLKDREWADEVYAKRVTAKQSDNELLTSIAEEEYEKIIATI